MQLRCLIVDDSVSFLDAARAILERQGMTIVGVATTAAEALQRHADLEPDVVLVDISLGNESGLELAPQLADGAGRAPSNVILISTHQEEDFAGLIAASPALGFLAKADLSAGAIEALLRGPGPASGNRA